MGSITPYETVAGRRYRVRWRAPDHTQKEKRGIRTKHAAEIYLASVQTKMATGEYIDPALSRATVGQRHETWLRARKAAMKPSAYRPLEITWRLHVAPRWENVRLTDVAYSDVQDWLSELAEKRSATVTLRAYGVLAGILDVAVRDRRIPSNPARGVVLPRKNKSDTFTSRTNRSSRSQPSLVITGHSSVCSRTPGCGGARLLPFASTTSISKDTGFRSTRTQ